MSDNPFYDDTTAVEKLKSQSIPSQHAYVPPTQQSFFARIFKRKTSKSTPTQVPQPNVETVATGQGGTVNALPTPFIAALKQSGSNLVQDIKNGSGFGNVFEPFHDVALYQQPQFKGMSPAQIQINQDIASGVAPEYVGVPSVVVAQRIAEKQQKAEQTKYSSALSTEAEALQTQIDTGIITVDQAQKTLEEYQKSIQPSYESELNQNISSEYKTFSSKRKNVADILPPGTFGSKYSTDVILKSGVESAALIGAQFTPLAPLVDIGFLAKGGVDFEKSLFIQDTKESLFMAGQAGLELGLGLIGIKGQLGATGKIPLEINEALAESLNQKVSSDLFLPIDKSGNKFVFASGKAIPNAQQITTGVLQRGEKGLFELKDVVRDTEILDFGTGSLIKRREFLEGFGKVKPANDLFLTIGKAEGGAIKASVKNIGAEAFTGKVYFEGEKGGQLFGGAAVKKGRGVYGITTDIQKIRNYKAGEFIINPNQVVVQESKNIALGNVRSKFFALLPKELGGEAKAITSGEFKIDLTSERLSEQLPKGEYRLTKEGFSSKSTGEKLQDLFSINKKGQSQVSLLETKQIQELSSQFGQTSAQVSQRQFSLIQPKESSRLSETLQGGLVLSPTVKERQDFLTQGALRNAGEQRFRPAPLLVFERPSGKQDFFPRGALTQVSTNIPQETGKGAFSPPPTVPFKNVNPNPFSGGFDFGGFFPKFTLSSGFGRFGKIRPAKTEYTPSFTAIELNLKATKRPKMLLGGANPFQLRPLIVSNVKKGRGRPKGSKGRRRLK